MVYIQPGMAHTGSSPIFSVSSSGRADIRLNRPKHRNRIEPSDLQTLDTILSTVETDQAVRVLVLTGTGETFSSGYDLASLAKGQADQQGEVDVYRFAQVV